MSRLDNATFVKRLEAILAALGIAPEGLCSFLLTGDTQHLPRPLARRLRRVLELDTKAR